MSEIRNNPHSTSNQPYQPSGEQSSDLQTLSDNQISSSLPSCPEEYAVATPDGGGQQVEGELIGEEKACPLEELEKTRQNKQAEILREEALTSEQSCKGQSGREGSIMSTTPEPCEPDMLKTTTSALQQEEISLSAQISEPSSSSTEPQTSFHNSYGAISQSAPITSTVPRQYDLLDFLAIAQRWQIDMLPLTWGGLVGAGGAGGTAKIAQGTTAMVSYKKLLLSFAFKHVKNHDDSKFRTLLSEVLVLGHPAIKRHPNIIELEGFCWDVSGETAWPVLVFKKMQHGDLEKFMCLDEGRRMGLDDRLKLCREIGNAVLLMHSCYIIHGDIKPTNVLIFEDKDGRYAAKVADFGYSTLLADQAEGEKVELPRSPPWAAPEITSGSVMTFEQAKSTDIFSFGMLCFWLLFHEILPRNTSGDGRPDLEILSEWKTQKSLLEVAAAEIRKLTGISEEQRNGLSSFFESSLKNDGNDRTLDLDGLTLPFGHQRYQAPNLTHFLKLIELSEKLTLIAQFSKSATLTPRPIFQLTSMFRKFTTTDTLVWKCIFRCFKNRAEDQTNDEADRNNAAFQLAICYKLGFGISADKGESAEWLRKSKREPKDIEDVVNMVSADEMSPYGDFDVNTNYVQPFEAGSSADVQKDARQASDREITDKGEISENSSPNMPVLGSTTNLVLSKMGLPSPFTKLDGMTITKSEEGTSVEDMKAKILRKFREEHGVDAAGYAHFEEISFSTGQCGSFAIQSSTCAANSLASQGNLEDAEELQIKSMETKMRVLGLDHLDTLASMEKLSKFYETNKRWNDAEKLQHQIMEAKIRLLGQDHPDTLASMELLGRIYLDLNRYEEAEDVFLRVMEVRMRVFGIDNEDTLTCLRSLALIYTQLEQFGEAEALQVQVVDARKKMRSSNHAEMLLSMECLVQLYVTHLQQFEEAEKVQLQIVNVRASLHGDEHPETLKSMDKLACIYVCRQLWKEAEQVYLRVIEIRTKVLGEEHEDMLPAMKSLVEIYKFQQRWKEVEKLQFRIAEIEERVFGPENLSTIKSKCELAATCMHLQHFKKAVELFEEVVEVRKRVFGEDEEDTLASIDDLAGAHKARGRFEEAVKLELHVLKKRQEILGAEHSSTVTSMINLAITYKLMGSWKKAEELINKVQDAWGGLESVEHPIMEGMENVVSAASSNLEDLDVLVLRIEEALQAMPDDHPQRPMSLSELSRIMKHRFEKFTRALEDLSEAIVWAEQAVMAVSEDHPARASLISMWGDLIWTRFEQSGDKGDMDEAVLKAEEAVSVSDSDNPDHTVILSNLADRLMSRFRHTKATDDLDASIIWAEQALLVLPESHPDRALMLSSLSNKFWRRFEQTGSSDDFDEALRIAMEAWGATSGDDPQLLRRLDGLADMLNNRFKRTGNIEDLEQAMLWAEQAVEASSKDDRRRGLRLAILGEMFGDKYKLSKSIDDLGEAIRNGESAESATLPTLMLGKLLDRLSEWFEERFKRTGTLEDFNEAIRRAEQTESLAATDAQLPLGAILSNLANKYMRRFRHTGAIGDLEKAVQKADRAVEVTPEGSRFWAEVVVQRDTIHQRLWQAFQE